MERGFHIIRQVAVENLTNLSHVSQHIICDAANKVGCILSASIMEELRTDVSAARIRYNAQMEVPKKERRSLRTLGSQKSIWPRMKLTI